MLRLLVLLLLAANLGYHGWSAGWFATLGAAPPQESEPQRVAQQIRPQSLRLLAADEVRRLETSSAGAPRPPECLQAGLFADAELGPLRQALDAWPGGSWQLEPGVEPARWLIYMGKYPGAEALNRKKGELRQLGVSFDPVPSPALEPGLSLGSFTSQAAAQQQLDALSRKGVRTAHVVQDRPEQRGQVLRMPALDDTLRAKLDELRPLLAGKPWRPCR
ncbi:MULTISPECIES: SPOR domain-containing protein [Ramlibacter]|uniref:SPOR domain-containing protein n=1 Tax=Ramlibacter aquaticus TaxID=2780094 RepID=A0ABR9SAY2_9BURK|nr:MULTISPECIES: SPOR domain-containing protein [Ramlibacter]MBE7939451.1 SPOR domain-containing protein [Ramlibacter aquaticus]